MAEKNKKEKIGGQNKYFILWKLGKKIGKSDKMCYWDYKKVLKKFNQHS